MHTGSKYCFLPRNIARPCNFIELTTLSLLFKHSCFLSFAYYILFIYFWPIEIVHIEGVKKLDTNYFSRSLYVKELRKTGRVTKGLQRKPKEKVKGKHEQMQMRKQFTRIQDGPQFFSLWCLSWIMIIFRIEWPNQWRFLICSILPY